MTKYVLKSADKVVPFSHRLKEKALSLCPPDKDIAVIHNGADCKQFCRIQDAKERLGIDETRNIVMDIGNLLPIKGVEFLIRAFAALLKDRERDDVVLFLIGDGSEKTSFGPTNKKPPD